MGQANGQVRRQRLAVQPQKMLYRAGARAVETGVEQDLLHRT